MIVYRSRNVNTMLRLVIPEIGRHGIREESRNGPVLRMPEPATLVYERPLERVCFCPIRDANPFFHLAEAMWMLAGRRDVEWIAQFNNGMRQYSDDGVTFNAAYGWRMGTQLEFIIEILKMDPDSRQAVAQLWDSSDLARTTKDKACNLCLVFSRQAGTKDVLDMTVYNRSNDAIWGTVAGANPVHMSFFHEYVAEGLGWSVGVYRQVTNNLHFYLGNEKYMPLLHYSLNDCDFYDLRGWRSDDWRWHIGRHMDYTNPNTRPDDYLEYVWQPVLRCWQLRKQGRHKESRDMIETCRALDWKTACVDWMDRRDGDK